MTPSNSWAVSSETPETLWTETDPPRHLSPELLHRWEKVLSEWEAPEASQDNLRRLATGSCRVVVTGQQPGFWGGPLYSLYKAAAAVALAERVTKKTGTPTIPVFWVQGDDTDWDEVGWGALPQRDLGLVRHRWNPGPVPSRHWIGSARVDAVDAMTAVSKSWGLDSGFFFPDIDPGRDLADSFARCLLEFLGHRGLVPLDSRWPEIRTAGQELWKRYVPQHEELSRKVLQAGAQLAESGRPGTIAASASDFGLFILEGEHRLPPDPKTWESRAQVLAAEQPQDLAPSVLLRGVLQDHLLGTSAQIVGASEGAYLRQLEPVYQDLEVLAPVRVPRLQATVIPRTTLPVGQIEQVVGDPEAWIRGRVIEHISGEAARALSALKQSVTKHLGTLADPDAEGSLGEMAEVTRRKIDSQIGKLEETALRQARKRLYGDEPMLRNLSEFLRPRRGPQERGISGASLAFFFGNDAAEVILKAAHKHLDRLEEGEQHHFTLEATRE